MSLATFPFFGISITRKYHPAQENNTILGAVFSTCLQVFSGLGFLLLKLFVAIEVIFVSLGFRASISTSKKMPGREL